MGNAYLPIPQALYPDLLLAKMMASSREKKHRQTGRQETALAVAVIFLVLLALPLYSQPNSGE